MLRSPAAPRSPSLSPASFRRRSPMIRAPAICWRWAARRWCRSSAGRGRKSARRSRARSSSSARRISARRPSSTFLSTRFSTPSTARSRWGRCARAEPRGIGCVVGPLTLGSNSVNRPAEPTRGTTMDIVFAAPTRPKSGTLVVGVLEERKLTPTAVALDRDSGGALTRAMEASRFKGRKDEVLGVLAPAKLTVGRVILMSLGKPALLDAAALQSLGGQIVGHLNSAGEKQGTVVLDALDDAKLKPAEAAANLAFGARLRAYRFDKYRTKEKPEQ